MPALGKNFMVAKIIKGPALKTIPPVLVPYAQQFDTEMRESEERMLRYLDSGYFRAEDDVKARLINEYRESDAPFLSANNTHARRLFYRAWAVRCEEFTRNKSSHFVTLMPLRYVKHIDAAHAFDLLSLQSWTRQMLYEFDHLSIVEAALFTNFQLGLLEPPAISFHTHSIVVSADPDALKAKIDDINVAHYALVPGVRAADARLIEPGDEHKVAKYMLKEPTGNYRAYPKKREVMDAETGEIIEQLTGRYRTKVALARPGLVVKVRNAVKDWHLDSIVFAGGAGRDALGALRQEVRRGIPARMRSEREREFSGYFDPKDDD